MKKNRIIPLTTAALVMLLTNVIMASEHGKTAPVDELTIVANIRTAVDVDSFLARQPEKIAVIEFWASWCYPCKIYKAEFHKVAAMGKYGRKVKFLTFNTDRALGVAKELKVNSLPTTLIYKRGKIESARVGVIESEDLEKLIDDVMQK